MVAPTGAALALLLTVGGLGFGAAGLLRAPAAPPASALPWLAALLTAPVLGQGLPIAALVGAAAALGRWREEGDWIGIRAAGWGGAALLPGLTLAALLTGGLTWGLTHRAEPAARSELRAMLRDGLRPTPGLILAFGGAAVVVERSAGDEAEGLLFGWVDAEGRVGVGAAERATWGQDGIVAEGGVVHLPDARLRFERATVPEDLAAAPSARVELVERSDDALRDLVTRMRANGRDASYEAAVLLKRDTWPAAAGLLILLAGPLGLSGRRGLLAGSALSYWVAVRAFDHLAPRVGAEIAAWSPPALLTIWVLWVWLRWRDR